MDTQENLEKWPGRNPEVMFSIKLTYKGRRVGEREKERIEMFLFAASSMFIKTSLLKWFLYLP